MVGTTGFEPATSPTPRVRDTRLRYVPTDSNAKWALLLYQAITCVREASRKRAKCLAGLTASCGLKVVPTPSAAAAPVEPMLAPAAPELSTSPFCSRKCRPRARNRKPFVIQQSLNPQHHLHIFLTIKPVPAGTLYWLEHGELRLPIPQNKRLQRSQTANLANPIKIFFNGRLRRCSRAWHIEFLSEGDAAILAVSNLFL